MGPRALVLLGASACASLDLPGEPLFVFDPGSREAPLAHYAYHSGHFELVYEVYLYPDRTVCYFRSRDPRRHSVRFFAGSTELAGLCSPARDRCTYPVELGVRFAVEEALRERAGSGGTLELHVYVHPDEAHSYDASIVLAEERAQVLVPLIEAEGVPRDQLDVLAHGWMGAAERVIHSDFVETPCDPSWLDLSRFATEEEKRAHGIDDSGLDFGEAEIDEGLTAELQARCRAAHERCRDARCLRSFDGLGWAELLGDPSRRQRSELAVAGPLPLPWLEAIRRHVERAGEGGPIYGPHIPSVSIEAGGHELHYRVDELPESARLLDTFFTLGVAAGCRFDAAPDRVELLARPRDVDFAPLQ